ncbi:MAG: GcrA cell cycle regulator [Hyphomicrobiaceae bacterium]|nr:GcrA cell cycle regulator [Hyphomicrobiaceae bacterium]
MTGVTTADAGFTWTDDRVELLKKLWNDGLSASRIASELGGVTRNAVIGKVHRLGLSGRAKAPAPAPRPVAKKPAPVKAPSAPARPSSPMTNGALALKPETAPRQAPTPRPVVYDLSEPPLIENATVLQLNEHCCRWPVGDPLNSDFHFCARKKDLASPYCAYHARMAYQPVADRRRTEKQRAAG